MNIRLEEPRDFSAVERLTREAFWNKYRPGCSEHYVLHQFRSRPEFVRELDCVLEEDGQIAAHIMYSRAEIAADDGRTIPILVFGPVSVHPARQGRGPFFLVKELRPGFLTGVTGTYRDPEGYRVADADVDAFDRTFPPKEKKKLPGQLN